MKYYIINILQICIYILDQTLNLDKILRDDMYQVIYIFINQ